MTVDYKNVSLKNDLRISKKNELKCALDLSEDALEKMLSITASVRGGECEVRDGEITYGGTVNFNAIFKAEEINRAEVGAKFTFKAPIDGLFDRAAAKYNVQDVRVKSDGGMLYAVCELIAELDLEKDYEKQIAVGVDCLEKSGELKRREPRQYKKTITVDDEFTSKRIKRALLNDAQAIVTAVSAETGVITLDGEAVLNVCLLPFSENGDNIIKETRVIPFRYELDADGVTADSPVSAKAAVSGAALKIYVDEGSGKATISADIGVELLATAYIGEDITFVADAFSKDHELILTRDTIEQTAVTAFASENFRTILKAECKVPEYSRLLKLVGERIEGVSYRKDGETLFVDGVIAGDAIFADSDNILSTEKLVAPFNAEFKASGDIADFAAILEECNAKIRSGEIECDVAMKISFATVEKTEASVISSIEEGADKARNDSAISVYIAKAGDEEWDVVKSLGEPAEAIRALNAEVEYPLKGGEKIIVFREKR